MVYDSVNNLAVLALSDVILVLSKATLNSNNRCEIVSKIQLSASSLLQLAELGVFFIGCQDGSLVMISWPHYSQEDLYLQNSHKTCLFDEPIVSIHVTPSKSFLYAVSESGSVALCELKVGEGQNLPNRVKELMVKYA